MEKPAINASAPGNVEDFARLYISEIQGFIHSKNKTSSIHLDPDDFVQDLLIKFTQEGTLQKYNPQRGASFRTWFHRVMLYFYLTKIRKKGAEEHVLIQGKDADSNPGGNPGMESLADKTVTDDIQKDAEMIRRLIEEVPEMRARLVIKLKLYPEITLNTEELDFIAEKTKIPKTQVLETIEERYRSKPGVQVGLRDKDMAQLLGYKSFTTQWARAVRKHILPRYYYLKGKHRQCAE